MVVSEDHVLLREHPDLLGCAQCHRWFYYVDSYPELARHVLEEHQHLLDRNDRHVLMSGPRTDLGLYIVYMEMFWVRRINQA